MLEMWLFGIDARSGSALDELEVVLDRMKQTGYDYEILFMDAEDSVLVKRYKESRRSHPLARAGRVDEGIRLEREKTKFLRKRADYIIDTSHLLTRELRQEIEKIFVDDREFSNIMISVLPSALSMESRQMQILCLMCDFFPIPIMWMNCVL